MKLFTWILVTAAIFCAFGTRTPAECVGAALLTAPPMYWLFTQLRGTKRYTEQRMTSRTLS